MPKDINIKKVLVIGSGPIIIGQAAEFDYSGTQACKAFKQEDITVVLINSNPATIMTDQSLADRIYIEPIELATVKKIIYREKPDGIAAGFGGQTALNMAVKLSEDGILDELGIRLLGTDIQAIKTSEDRELFKNAMSSLGQKTALSRSVSTVDEAAKFAFHTGFPLIIRPAYTLGGSGGGIAADMTELKEICKRGLKLSMISQVLIEQSVAGWKEIEYEVMRDSNDNCITICNMENFDPVGIHTGDSIVIAPSQTLSDKEYQMLRSASVTIIRALGIKGGCNIQFALKPDGTDYVVIEVNPRVSRSSALASKATGYPIAWAAAKIAIGINLDEMPNMVTKTTTMMFEPSLDYVVTKIPRWPFDKFGKADRLLGTQMKSTGEVMAFGRTFEESLLKAIDSLDVKFNYQLGLSLFDDKTDADLIKSIKDPTDERLFAIFKALQRGFEIQFIHDICKVDTFFLHKLKNIVTVADRISSAGIAWLDYELYRMAKIIGFGDSYIANLVNVPIETISNLRSNYPISPVYKMVDTCAAEFLASTPYYYSTYEEEDELSSKKTDKVLVIGSGPIRIGQGIEFDYCSVHSVMALRELGYESLIVNNNPETVSTDFDISDKLFFEPLTKECVLDILHKEDPHGIIVQFGGQTAINLASVLHDQGVNILGTPVSSIADAEDRSRFIDITSKLGIPVPPGSTSYSFEEAEKIAKMIGYPVLVRPSFVLGGRAMQIVHDSQTLKEYIDMATDISKAHPILVDKYIDGKEAEVDGICDGDTVLIPGIMEHIEKAGVHSGDSIAVYPPVSLSKNVKDTIVEYSILLSKALKTKGLFNIQFVISKDEKVYVIEANPRASRTVPVLSKITGIPMVNLATKVIMGKSLKELGYSNGLYPENKYYAVKAPVFSFSKLKTVDPFLGPEMKSTGEVMGVSPDYHTALYKALISANMDIPSKGAVLLSLEDTPSDDCVYLASVISGFGFEIYATKETYPLIERYCKGLVNDDQIIDHIKDDAMVLVINLPTGSLHPSALGFTLRRTCIEYGVTCLTSLDTVKAVFEILQNYDKILKAGIHPLDEYSKPSGGN